MKTLLAIVLVMMMGGVAMADNNAAWSKENELKLQEGIRNGDIVLGGDYVYVGQGRFQRMDNPAPLSELIAAAKEVLPYLKAPSAPPTFLHSADLVYRPLPNELELAEKEVDRLKEKDAAIRRYRRALQAVQ